MIILQTLGPRTTVVPPALRETVELEEVAVETMGTETNLLQVRLLVHSRPMIWCQSKMMKKKRTSWRQIKL